MKHLNLCMLIGLLCIFTSAVYAEKSVTMQNHVTDIEHLIIGSRVNFTTVSFSSGDVFLIRYEESTSLHIRSAEFEHALKQVLKLEKNGQTSFEKKDSFTISKLNE